MKLRVVLPWALFVAAAAVAIWSLTDRPSPQGPTTVAIEAPPTDAPVPGPDLGPPAEEVTSPPERESGPEPEAGPGIPTGLELSRGAITMHEMEDPRTGERYYRVTSRPAPVVAQPVPVPEVEPAPEPDIAVDDEEPDLLDLEEPVEAAPPAPTEEDLRRIVREELAAREEEDRAVQEEELTAARAADLARFARDANLSARGRRDLQRLLDHEVDVIERTQAALQRRELTVHEAWRKLDTERSRTERKLRSLLGERGYAMYHERGMGWVLTGHWTMHTGTREALTTWR